MNTHLSLVKTLALVCGAALVMVGVVLVLIGAPNAVQAAPMDTIQSMIDSTPDGGTVSIAAGAYTESLTVNKTLTLTGVSSTTTIIRAVGGQRVITVTAGHNLRLVNLTLTGGTSTAGGGVYAAGGNLQIINCRIANNSADYGGGVFQTGTDKRVDVIGSRIELNTTGNHGGGLYVDGSAALTNTLVLSNSAGWHGGGLHVQNGRTDLNGGWFSNNRALGDNGGAVNVNNSISVTGTQFISNTANDSGGGLVQWNAGYTVTAINARFERNTARSKGGGAYIAGPSLISTSTFMTNTVDSGSTTNTYGGGVYAGGATQIFASTFVSNSARCTSCSYMLGGGLYTSKPATIQDGTFDRNYAWDGGGAFGDGVVITVAHSTFKNNLAGYGGAIDAGAIWATGSDFLSNRAVNKGGALGALDITLSGTRLLSNTSGAPGGSLWVVNRLDAVNTLFAGSQAGWGAAVMQLEGSQYTLRHVTIAHPSLGAGPAIGLTSGTANITDTIIASYTVGISQTNGILNADYDLFFTATPTQTSGGTLNWGLHNLNANPRFANPAAGDYHLAAGSPAIDKGTNVGVTIDLDGVTRPQGSGYDIGAYETSPASGPCYARLVSNSATYTSTDASAVQYAIDVAPQGGTVKIAGTCAGVQMRGGISQTVYISKSLTLRGGYTTTNWITSNPIVNPTVLDAQQAGRVVSIQNAPGLFKNEGLPAVSSKLAIAQSTRSQMPQVPSVLTTISLENLIVRGGLSAGGGGILDDGAQVTLSNSTVRDNSVTSPHGGGGILIWHSGTLTVTNSLLTNNRAGYGGGIFNNNSRLVLINSTLSGNQSPTGSPGIDGGGALDQYAASASATLINSTIVSNTAIITNTSGIWLEGGTLNIGNSIVAHNGITANILISNSLFTSLGYNLTNSGVGTPFTATTDLTSTDPLLGLLHDNGGSTWTHALLPGSPAIDRVPIGVNGCGTSITVDQRGQPRPGPLSYLCDSGAYEVQGLHHQVYLPVVIK